MGAYSSRRQGGAPVRPARALFDRRHTPPPDPPDFGRFVVTLGAGEWYRRRPGVTIGETDTPPIVSGRSIVRIRWVNSSLTINITGGERFSTFRDSTPHILFLTHSPDWEAILTPSTAPTGFGGRFGRYLAQSDTSRDRLAALVDGESVELAFLHA